MQRVTSQTYLAGVTRRDVTPPMASRLEVWHPRVCFRTFGGAAASEFGRVLEAAVFE